MNYSKSIPTILVILGSTGDLMARKITPALFHLHKKDKLPGRFRAVGVARRPLAESEFCGMLETSLAEHADIGRGKKISSFLKLFSYRQGDLKNLTDYRKLDTFLKEIDDEWGVCANKLFYLAVPPELYESIVKNLAASGLTAPCSPEEGWTRVIVEKPFGKDLRTAEELDLLLARLFREEQIYRIDHYLAKEMLQNILTFRFSNNIFEKSWSGEFIEKVDIRLLEIIGAEDRGAFYDGVGALRDVGQNHLLQMLALVAMEHPLKFSAENIRKKRAEILRSLKTPTEEEIKDSSVRAQYQGYRKTKGVDPNSQTETYFKVKAGLSSSRFSGVEFNLESGKRVGKVPRKEIEVIFRHPSPCLCPPGKELDYRNKVKFSLEPLEGIHIKFWSKKPGLEMEMEERTFEFHYRRKKKKSKTQYVEEYEKLLLDCIAGDQTLFVSTGEIKEMWKFTDPFIKAWGKGVVPLGSYKPNSAKSL